MKRFLALTFITLAAGCSLVEKPAAPDPEIQFEANFDRTEDFMRMIEGNWMGDGPVQAVHIARLPEFKRAFYVEEVWSTGEPRQWIYMVEKKGPSYMARTWRLTRPNEFSGAWNDSRKLAEMSMYYLRAHEDCDVAFRWKDGKFQGETVGGGCAGLVEGDPEFVTTRVAFNETEMNYHVQAYDADGVLVRGTGSPQRLLRQ